MHAHSAHMVPSALTAKYNLADLTDFIMRGDLPMVKDILAYFFECGYFDAINDAGRTGLSPLHRALISPCVDDAIILSIFFYNIDPNVKAGKNVAIKYKGQKVIIFSGWNAAHIAVRFFAEGHILHILNEKETNFAAKDDEGCTPLNVAINCGNDIAYHFILSLGRKNYNLDAHDIHEDVDCAAS